MRIGLLTGGGDCPSLNAAIRAAVRRGEQLGHEFLGFREGWRGVVDGLTQPLDSATVRGLLPIGGTILGTSRTNPLKAGGEASTVVEQLRRHEVDALIAIGGEDTLGVATRVASAGFPVVGIPKTIDNDLRGTDVSIGFDTAVNIGMESMDRLHTTADSHQRVMILEVMGRHAGWIALNVGLAGGASAILIPEQPFDLNEVSANVEDCYARGHAPIVVVAEGAVPKGGSMPWQNAPTDDFGHPRLLGVGTWLEGELESRVGRETRTTVLGHIQRGGSPSAYDRVLATRFGLHAVQAVSDGRSGVMVALRGTDIVEVLLAEATKSLSTVPPDRLKEARAFLG